MSSARPILPSQLSAKLAGLATCVDDKAFDRELDAVLAGLAALPARDVVRASREILINARLGRWQPRLFYSTLLDRVTGLQSATARARSDQALLRTHPKSAWLFLFHPSGYVREAALRHVTTHPTSPFFLAALAFRLNDWAEPVRHAAKQCVKRIAFDVAPDVAADAAVYLLERRFVWGRWRDEAGMLDLVFARDDVLATLAMHLAAKPTGPLAICLRHALRYPGMDRHLPSLASAAVQPAVRALAYQCLISGRVTWIAGYEWAWIDKVYGLRRVLPKLDTRMIHPDRPAVDFVEQGIRDKSPFVRRIVADGMIAVRSQMHDEEALVAHMAQDSSAAVRSRADFLLRHSASKQ